MNWKNNQLHTAAEISEAFAKTRTVEEATEFCYEYAEAYKGLSFFGALKNLYFGLDYFCNQGLGNWRYTVVSTLMAVEKRKN